MTVHLAWPLRIAGTSLATVPQDTLEDVRQCVHSLLATRPGERPLAPQIGIEDPAFTVVDPELLAAELMEQEPRAAITIEVDGPDATGVQAITVHVELAEGDSAGEEEEAE